MKENPLNPDPTIGRPLPPSAAEVSALAKPFTTYIRSSTVKISLHDCDRIGR